MHSFTVAFLVALVLATALRLWLATRHIGHVRAHRNRVPAEFADRITPADHEKAADYTVAKTRIGMLDAVVGIALLLAFTLGGGLEALASAWAGVFDAGGYAHGIALILSVLGISSLIDLPFGLYRTFVVEARFGFNRMTALLYFADMAKQIAIGLSIGVPLIAGVRATPP